MAEQIDQNVADCSLNVCLFASFYKTALTRTFLPKPSSRSPLYARRGLLPLHVPVVLPDQLRRRRRHVAGGVLGVPSQVA